MKTVNQVLMTTDYNMFKNLNGNRNVNPLHLNRYIYQPSDARWYRPRRYSS